VRCDLRVNAGKSAADQAKRSVLLMRVGIRMSRCLGCKPVPSLMTSPLGSSSGVLSLTGSRRASRPTLGSKSSPDKAISKLGGRSIWLV